MSRKTYTLVDAEGNAVGYVTGRPEQVEAKYPAKRLQAGKLPMQVQAGALPRTMLRVKRNRLLDAWGWTVAAHSPLTRQNQTAWMRYLKELHRLLRADPDPANVVWPEMPPLEYANE